LGLQVFKPWLRDRETLASALQWRSIFLGSWRRGDSLVEKTLAYIARGEECQVEARNALTDESKFEFLKLAVLWSDLADARRKFL
jgi:hypothetical protein